MGAPVAFFEIISGDAERARRFYADLFGWKGDADPAMGGYALIDTASADGSIGGGIGSDQDDAAGVRIYMRVDDLEAYLTRAVELGGKRIQPPTDLPGGYGQIAMFADPDGNRVGLWK
jgi:predicted enzyme related to lactoylglutathione lyase